MTAFVPLNEVAVFHEKRHEVKTKNTEKLSICASVKN